MLTQTNINTTSQPLYNIGVVLKLCNNITYNNVSITTNSNICSNNIGISFIDSNATLNNIKFIINSGTMQNIGIKTDKVDDLGFLDVSLSEDEF